MNCSHKVGDLVAGFGDVEDTIVLGVISKKELGTYSKEWQYTVTWVDNQDDEVWYSDLDIDEFKDMLEDEKNNES